MPTKYNMADEEAGLRASGRQVSYNSIDSQEVGSTQNLTGRPSARLSLVNVGEACTLSWNHLNAWADSPDGKGCCGRKKQGSGPPKHILNDVCGQIHPGTLMAVMGASGAGKSTFMNVLTSRNLEGLRVDGEVLVNGENLGTAITRVSAYVQQDGLFLGTLKVKEHLWFNSMLRMKKGMSNFEREQRVFSVMAELGLTKCANSTIGVPGRITGISGGEKKRLQFATEVLTNPALMFCDEPTSGLDSFMAMTVVETLSTMAKKGKTIMCTIHQPSSEVFALFDNVLLLAEGRVAFIGTISEAMTFFESTGYPCPTNFNPADHFIYKLAIMPGKVAECTQRVQSIVDAYEHTDKYQQVRHELDQIRPSDEHITKVLSLKRGSPYRANCWQQFRTVLWRSWVTSARDPMIVRSRLLQSVFTALFLGLVYLQTEYSMKGVMNINGGLFMLQIGASLGNVFAVVNTFPLEFPIFRREYQDGMYRLSIYYTCKFLAELPTFIIMPTILLSIAYWMIGLYPSADAYAIALGAVILISNVAVSFGYMVGTMSSNMTLILAIAPLIMTPLMMFGGFFLNSGTVPVYFIWLKYLSWFNYCNEILIVNQWRHVKNITCDIPAPPIPPHNTSMMSHLQYISPMAMGGGMCYPDGQAVIDSLSYSEDNLLFDILMLVALMVGFRFFSFVFLWLRSRRKE